MEWSFDRVDPVEADVEIPAGRTEVVASQDGRIVVVLEPSSSSCSELVESAEVTMSNGRLVVHVPSRLIGRGEVRCRLTLPEESSLWYRSASAPLRCEVPLAALEAKTASGDVNVRDVRGDATLNSASGDLSCGEVGGRTTVKTASGDVRVGHAGGELRASLASGDLEVGDSAASLEVTTASGDVRVTCARSGRLKATSASGDIVIGVAPGVGAYLDVTSVTGDMDCDLPFGEAQPQAAELQIVCRTVSGDVRIEAAVA